MADLRDAPIPIDFDTLPMGMCVTPDGHGIGLPLTPTQIDERLSRLPLRPTIRALVEATTASRTSHSRSEEMQLARRFLRERDRRRFERVSAESDEPLSLFSRQALKELATRALLSCADHRVPVPSDLDRQIGTLAIAISGTNDDASTVENLPLVLTQGSTVAREWVSPWSAEVAHSIVVDVLPDRGELDLAEMVRGATGVGLETFWAITLTAAMTWWRPETTLVEYPKFPEADSPDGKHIQRWTAAHTIDLHDLRQRAAERRGEESQAVFASLVARPFVDAGDADALLVPWADLVARKASPIGVHDMVVSMLKAKGEYDGDSWPASWGRVIEDAGRRFVRQHRPHGRILLDEAEIRARWGRGPACDLVVDEGDVWIAADFVKRPYSVATLSSGGMEDLGVDLERTVVDKLGQIDSTVSRGLAAEGTSAARHIWPLVIVGGTFAINDIGMAVAAMHPRALGFETVFRDPRCRAPKVIEIDAFLALLSYAAAENRPLSDYLEEWEASEDRQRPLDRWLHNRQGCVPPSLESFRWWRHTHTVINAME